MNMGSLWMGLILGWLQRYSRQQESWGAKASGERWEGGRRLLPRGARLPPPSPHAPAPVPRLPPAPVEAAHAAHVRVAAEDGDAHVLGAAPLLHHVQQLLALGCAARVRGHKGRGVAAGVVVRPAPAGRARPVPRAGQACPPGSPPSAEPPTARRSHPRAPRSSSRRRGRPESRAGQTGPSCLQGEEEEATGRRR